MASLKDLSERVAKSTVKDQNNLSNQADSFLAESGFKNVETGETAKGDSAQKIADNQTPGEAGEIASTGINNPGLVEPITASQDPLYNAKANAESYEVEKQGEANQTETIPGKKNVYFSNFNQWSLFNYSGGPFESGNINYNAPIYAGPTELDYRNPTATRIIENTNTKNNPAYRYTYGDFALAKYYGKIPNTHMITLRRFPTPVEDNIISPNILGPDGSKIEKGMPDLARAVTWMDEATENKLSDILKFSVSTEWKKVESQIQEISGQQSKGGKLGSAIGGSGLMSSIYGAANGMDAQATRNAKNGFDATKGTYPNHIFGPINVIKEVMIRDQGLGFEQGFDLKFHYSLRQLQGVSPKVAFLDMLSNMLVLTYNNGNFWGGSVRHIGGKAFQKPFGDYSKMKGGDFGGFLGSLVGDAMKGLGNITKDIKENGLMGSKLGNNLIGGGLMDLFGTPQGGEAINAFLTGDPTGQYHVTVGNPLFPIATIGNLYCEGADFEFGGEMSYEGFPTELTVTVKLKPARPRDKADIETMFNGGKERMYLTPEGGVNTNQSSNTSAYGNADSAQQADIYKKMTNG